MVGNASCRAGHRSAGHVAFRHQNRYVRHVSEAVGTVAINAVVAADASGRITQFNPAAERTFGWHEHEVLGESVTVLIRGRDRDTYRLQVEQLFSSEDALNAGRVIELAGRRKDGTEFPL